jgi:ABC-type molybdate transport system substrate-binding protein
MASQLPCHALVGWALTAFGIVGTAGAAGAGTPVEHPPTVLLVFAAASLSDALEEVDRAFTARTGVRVNASYAASSLLAKQIEAGAPADVFVSADRASHPPITYPVALTVRARPEAARLADFLTGETARQIFTRYGFAPLPAREAHN